LSNSSAALAILFSALSVSTQNLSAGETECLFKVVFQEWWEEMKESIIICDVTIYADAVL
jgi:hypothetical protein